MEKERRYSKSCDKWLVNHQKIQSVFKTVNILYASIFRKDPFDVSTPPTSTLSKPDRSRPPDLADIETTKPKFSGLHLDTGIQQFQTHINMHENINIAKD